jgi:hypothetical protein
MTDLHTAVEAFAASISLLEFNDRGDAYAIVGDL